MKHTFEEAKDIFSCPFFKLLRIAHEIHVQNFDEQSVQISDILSVKTGGCSEDTVPIVPSPPETQPMLDLKTVLEAARKAKECGASFCMSTSGPCPASEVEFKKICEMVRSVKALGLETCVTLGFLTEAQATKLDESGLDYYNYSVDTSPEFYANIVSTRTVDDRINTIETEQKTGLHVPETLSAWEKAMKTESECLFCSRILPFRPDVCR